MHTVNQRRDYIKTNNALEEKRVIVTTHSRLLTLSPEMIRQYTVIIDEDIISTLFKNIKSASLQSVQTAFHSSTCPAILKNRLEQIIGMSEGRYAKFEGVPCFEFLSLQELKKLEIVDNINEIAVASVFQKDGNTVHYFIPQILSEGKYIILSATSNIDLYRRYFPGRYIKEYPYNRAKYKGSLKQLTNYPMSRQCIQTCKKELKVFLVPLSCDYHMITFMTYKNEELRNLQIYFISKELEQCIGVSGKLFSIDLGI